MATQANYVSTPRCGLSQVSTANTNRDGTGTIVSVLAAGSNGSRIDSLSIKAVAATTAGMIRLFVTDGAVTRLVTEVPVIAQTPGAATPSWEVQLNTNTMSQVLPIILPTGFSLAAATNNAEVFNVVVYGGDF
jgi:hypothetical protein